MVLSQVGVTNVHTYSFPLLLERLSLANFFFQGKLALTVFTILKRAFSMEYCVWSLYRVCWHCTSAVTVGPALMFYEIIHFQRSNSNENKSDAHVVDH